MGKAKRAHQRRHWFDRVSKELRKLNAQALMPGAVCETIADEAVEQTATGSRAAPNLKQNTMPNKDPK
ncbi:hypothetical protein SAMN04487965_3569 [Microbulbifer donghaiensis]|uniref:Uncharacterized protein n=1 Tax=Microbulbifer donghaiensis TaxID=494016 RepID=A0A1M5I482_9GAMM|nr:hypothetical protein [Microbulbifer donghaiensis]SHG23062.1 hypothetical protein SAMN04487965_3569 [Microbulbifer donghaiensis]